MTGPLLVLEHATKSFGPVKALEDGSIELSPGEAHALIGENGVGKSTLVKLLAGVHRPDSGRLLLDGQELRLANPADAREAGIAVIYQEPTLFPDLSVAENIFMGRQPLTGGRRIDGGALRRQVLALMERLGVALDPNRPARGLSIADQQIVEIAKALSFDARVIVMDEPTAALSGAEVERLFAVTRTLLEHGAAVLFVSHRLDEVFALCQRVTVMRDGRHVFSGPLEGLTNDDLVRRMVGRELATLFPKQPAERGGVALSVRRLTREGVFTDVSFEVHHGEIVGLAGLVGAGRSEVQLLAKQINNTGEIAILSATPNATNQNSWIEFMRDELEKPEYRNMKLVKVAYGNDDDQDSFQQTQGLLQAYPNLKGIISPTTVGIAAAARYLSASEYKGKVALTGLGTPNQMRKFVEDGTVQAFELWDPGKLGYLAAYAAAALASGQITGKEGESFKAGELGDYKVGKGGEVLLGPPQVFDKQNIGQFDF